MSSTIRLAQPGPQADLLDPTNFNGGSSAYDLFLSIATDWISEKGTLTVYHRRAGRFFAWADDQDVPTAALQTHHAAAYRDDLVKTFAAPSVNQHLSALRRVFDRMLLRGIVDSNPFLAVHGIKLSRSRGKHPRPSAEDARRLLMSIEDSGIAGLRDKALIASIVFSSARLGALLAFNVADYHESHHLEMTFDLDGDGRTILRDVMDSYIISAGIAQDSDGPLFRTIGRSRLLTKVRMSRCDTFRMVRRRGSASGLAPSACCCRSLRAVLNKPCRPT